MNLNKAKEEKETRPELRNRTKKVPGYCKERHRPPRAPSLPAAAVAASTTACVDLPAGQWIATRHISAPLLSAL
jgi:hypothetical protein